MPSRCSVPTRAGNDNHYSTETPGTNAENRVPGRYSLCFLGFQGVAIVVSGDGDRELQRRAGPGPYRCRWPPFGAARTLLRLGHLDFICVVPAIDRCARAAMN